MDTTSENAFGGDYCAKSHDDKHLTGYVQVYKVLFIECPDHQRLYDVTLLPVIYYGNYWSVLIAEKDKNTLIYYSEPFFYIVLQSFLYQIPIH